MLNDPLPENIISASEAAEVEALYRRITTPLRCRLGWHRWLPWNYVMSLNFQGQHVATGRLSQAAEIDLEIRLCPGCGKVGARAVNCHTVEDLVAPEDPE